ncbi:MAG: hypothetical protein Q7R95_00475 [bacterium]|nr:hypothetical protein [bacterium]
MDKKKKLLFCGLIVVVLIVVGALFILNNKSNKAVSKPTVNDSQELVIPTVDSSVIVDLSSSIAGKEVVLKINGIPASTTSFEYQLSYQTKQQGFQGVTGTVSSIKDSSFEKTIKLGTCSSGTCVYHQVVGTIKVTLRFTGSYGDKIFEKDFIL